MRTITVVTACYNEEDNITELYRQVKAVFLEKLPQYQYEHLFIDNASKDRTVEILRKLPLLVDSFKNLFGYHELTNMV